MKVKDVMTPDVECIGPDGSLQDAAIKMKTRDIGPILVCEGDTVVGILTDRDIVVRAVAEGRDARTTRVQDCMTRDVVFVKEDDDVKDAARRMKDHQVRRVVVLTRDGKLCGIVSTKDIAVDTGDKKMAGDVLKEVSEDAAMAGKR